MKPYEQQRVEKALQRVQFPDSSAEWRRETSSSPCRMAEKLKKLSLWKGDRVLLIDMDDIVFLAMSDRNCPYL